MKDTKKTAAVDSGKGNDVTGQAVVRRVCVTRAWQFRLRCFLSVNNSSEISVHEDTCQQPLDFESFNDKYFTVKEIHHTRPEQTMDTPVANIISEHLLV